MSKSLKWIISVIICVGLFAGAYVLYQSLSDQYNTNQIADDNTQSDNQYAAPDFTVYTQDGKAVKLSDFKGRPVVLNFWASWCYYCTEEMPDFNKAYLNNKDIEFLMVNVTDGQQETMDNAQSFLKQYNYDFNVYYDTELQAANAYGASSLPMTIFIDKDGNLVTYAKGLLSAENLDKGISYIK